MLGAEILAFLQACPMTVLVLDTAGRIIFVNEAGKLIHLEDRLVGMDIARFMPEWPLLSGVSTAFVCDRFGHRQLCRVRVMNWPVGTKAATVIFLEPADAERPAGYAAREANLRLRYVIEMLPEAVCVFDASDRYVLWNQKYAELYADIAEHLRPGIAFEEILRISLAGGEMRELVEDKEAWFRERMKKFHQPVAQEEQQLRDGRWLRHDDRRTPDGGAIGMRIDITDLKQREDWLRQLFDANPMPMLLCDGNSLAILQANKAAVDFYGFQRSDLLSKRACDMHAEGEVHAFEKALLDLEGHCDARTIWRQTTREGLERHVLIYVRLLYEGSERRLLLTVADVSDRILAEAEANRLAHHDVLTGLPNRMQFYKALAGALVSGQREKVVICYLDLDGFKPVNDTFGHAAGDEVLKSVAKRLQIQAREHLVARLGGDEFAILMTGERAESVDLAERCIASFEEPFAINGLAIRLGVSIGIAAADGSDGEALMQEADRALYRAKADGRNTWQMMSEDGPVLKRAKA
ncbi:diguanylate cyclase (GGDEF)-like protein/PAS domain S-box-containing protein [Rhizobium sp. BK529]|uniref:diguanylate cyclase domain-containing protein n=1 Tax=unclassified Rhizobium TaxID=2613769 RepID=UPI0010D02901|nr:MULTISPECIES: diguanylate cyclase [unclassified Rhizobium]MBB3593149.1 diguanylate cyclase (GGDEF)-like protein/PAS domain S-box-containing protein [Rhizobium sp. BK529]TCS02947.1 PAS domain S-box-containing protein/diguanylate cyclase (GGDEF)-like protein [Rhizobium sp. BK418]